MKRGAISAALPEAPITGLVELEERDRLRLAAMAGRGQSQKYAARELGLDPMTLRKIFERDERAAEAWELGRGELERKLVGKLIEIAMDDTHQKQVLAILALLNNVYGWAKGDGQESEASRVRLVLELPAALEPGQYAALVARGREVEPAALDAEANGAG